MKRNRGAGVLSAIGFALVVAAAAVTSDGATIAYSLVNPGSDTVAPGVPFDLEIRASFDTPLVATDYRLRASGDATATLIARSQDPTGPVGLTYVSQTSQDPFENGLPFDLSATTLKEVAYDADFGGDPGGSTDGVPPSAPGDVVLDTLTIVAAGTGSLTITMSSAKAATTSGAPDGVMFDTVTIDNPVVELTIGSLPGDMDGDGDVDFVDLAEFAGCLSGPLVPAPGDGDADGDVDLNDFTAWEPCLSGPDVVPTPGCEDDDLDLDLDVDLGDFAAFQLFFTGSVSPVPPDCELGDIDGDNDVDLDDFSDFQEAFTG